jgi:hypothetical protein
VVIIIVIISQYFFVSTQAFVRQFKIFGNRFTAITKLDEVEAATNTITITLFITVDLIFQLYQ